MSDSNDLVNLNQYPSIKNFDLIINHANLLCVSLPVLYVDRAECAPVEDGVEGAAEDVLADVEVVAGVDLKSAILTLINRQIEAKFRSNSNNNSRSNFVDSINSNSNNDYPSYCTRKIGRAAGRGRVFEV